MIRVLILVNQDIFKFIPILLPYFNLILKESDRLHKQIIKIHRPAFAQPLLVQRIKLRRSRFEISTCSGGKRLGIFHLVLGG